MQLGRGVSREAMGSSAPFLCSRLRTQLVDAALSGRAAPVATARGSVASEGFGGGGRWRLVGRLRRSDVRSGSQCTSVWGDGRIEAAAVVLELHLQETGR